MARALAQLLKRIRAEHHQEFLRFVETCEATPDFLAYLDSDEDCQHAMEEALAPETELMRQAVDRIRRKVREDGSTETVLGAHPVNPRGAGMVFQRRAGRDLDEDAPDGRMASPTDGTWPWGAPPGQT